MQKRNVASNMALDVRLNNFNLIDLLPYVNISMETSWRHPQLFVHVLGQICDKMIAFIRL